MAHKRGDGYICICCDETLPDWEHTTLCDFEAFLTRFRPPLPIIMPDRSLSRAASPDARPTDASLSEVTP
jgi:hypothetical protein